MQICHFTGIIYSYHNLEAPNRVAQKSTKHKAQSTKKKVYGITVFPVAARMLEFLGKFVAPI